MATGPSCGHKGPDCYKKKPGSYGGSPAVVADNTLNREFDVDAFSIDLLTNRESLVDAVVPLLGAHAEGAEDYAVSRLHGLQAADHFAAFGLVERTAGNHQQVDVALGIVIAAGL